MTKDTESADKTIEQLAEELEKAIYRVRSQNSGTVRDLLIEFAEEIKRSAIEP